MRIVTMDFYQDVSMNLRAKNSASASDFARTTNEVVNRARLPLNVEKQNYSNRRDNAENVMSPIRQTVSLSSFFPSPTRIFQQLPESPASLLHSPSLRRFDRQTNSVSMSPNDERQLTEEINKYFLRRRDHLQQNIDLSMNIGRWFLENLIFYSIETLRRQAQIQSQCSCAYLTPMSAIRMIFVMKSQQGLGVLWKGCFSSLILTSGEMISNNLIDELAPFDRRSFREKHLILKAISSFLVIPLYSVHFLRSIQSDLTIVNQWSPLTIFIEPFQRVLGIKTGFYARALPLWYLISLTVPYFVFQHGLERIFCRKIRQQRQKQCDTDESQINSKMESFETVDDIECRLIDTIPNLVKTSFIRIESSLLAVFLSKLVLYPYETVMNRLFVQGTRTIIDNLESSTPGCIPVNTRYLGFFDCSRTIFETEGRFGRGFFKGFGFFLLKFAFIYAGAHCLKLLIERAAILYTQNTSELSKFHQYVLSTQEEPINENRDEFQSH